MPDTGPGAGNKTGKKTLTLFYVSSRAYNETQTKDKQKLGPCQAKAKEGMVLAERWVTARYPSPSGGILPRRTGNTQGSSLDQERGIQISPWCERKS